MPHLAAAADSTDAAEPNLRALAFILDRLDPDMATNLDLLPGETLEQWHARHIAASDIVDDLVREYRHHTASPNSHRDTRAVTGPTPALVSRPKPTTQASSTTGRERRNPQ